MKYPYIRPSNKTTITSSSKICYLPRTQSRNERNKFTDDNLENNSQYMPGKQNVILKIPTPCHFRDMTSLRRPNEFDYRNMLKMNDDIN